VSGYAVPRHPYFTLQAANVPRASSKKLLPLCGRLQAAASGTAESLLVLLPLPLPVRDCWLA
jgi:hypothetical protein